MKLRRMLEPPIGYGNKLIRMLRFDRICRRPSTDWRKLKILSALGLLTFLSACNSSEPKVLEVTVKPVLPPGPSSTPVHIPDPAGVDPWTYAGLCIGSAVEANRKIARWADFYKRVQKDSGASDGSGSGGAYSSARSEAGNNR